MSTPNYTVLVLLTNNVPEDFSNGGAQYFVNREGVEIPDNWAGDRTVSPGIDAGY